MNKSIKLNIHIRFQPRRLVLSVPLAQFDGYFSFVRAFIIPDQDHDCRLNQY